MRRHSPISRYRRWLRWLERRDSHAACVVFLDKLVDLAQKLFGPIRLADEAAVVCDLGFSRLYLARGDYEQHAGPALMHLAGKLQSVAAGRHLNVCKEQSDVFPRLHHL